MTTFLVSALAAECLFILLWALRKTERLIQYPFLATAVFAGWVLPQMIGLSIASNLPPGALDKTIVFTILCVGAIWLGYNWSNQPSRFFWWTFDRQRLLLGSAALCAIGAYFAYRVSLLAAAVTLDTGGQWTGVITIYEFFSHLITMGMVIAFLVHLRRPNWATLTILIFCVAFYADRILIKGRRAAMVELAVIVIFGLWFQRRKLLPRWFMVLSLCAGALLVNSIGEYRGVMLGPDRTTWSGASLLEAAQIDYVGNFMRAVRGERGNFEVTNAAMNIEATDRLFNFNFGLSLWNGVVDRFVPGQWVGVDAKRAMKADLTNSSYAMFRYVSQVGSTWTGMSDTYSSFWYFGCLEFLVAGLLMGRWYRAALGGNLVAQMATMLIMPSALEAITHSMDEFVSETLEVGLFLLPVVLFARVAPSRLHSLNELRA